MEVYDALFQLAPLGPMLAGLPQGVGGFCHARIISIQLLAQAQGKERPMEHPTFYRTTPIDGLSIFYREAGPKDVPKAELHVLDAGHFALDTAADQIAQLVRGFMQ